MSTYSRDQLFLIKNSFTDHTETANREIIRVLRDSACPIAQLKRRNRRQRGWMAGLRKVTPEKNDIAIRTDMQCSKHLQQIGRP